MEKTFIEKICWVTGNGQLESKNLENKIIMKINRWYASYIINLNIYKIYY